MPTPRCSTPCPSVTNGDALRSWPLGPQTLERDAIANCPITTRLWDMCTPETAVTTPANHAHQRRGGRTPLRQSCWPRACVASVTKSWGFRVTVDSTTPRQMFKTSRISSRMGSFARPPHIEPTATLEPSLSEWCHSNNSLLWPLSQLPPPSPSDAALHLFPL